MCFGDMDYRTLRRETEDRLRDVPKVEARAARDWGAILGAVLDAILPKPQPDRKPVPIKVKGPRG